MTTALHLLFAVVLSVSFTAMAESWFLRRWHGIADIVYRWCWMGVSVVGVFA